MGSHEGEVRETGLPTLSSLFLEHGQPLIFGADRDRGIRLNGLKPEIVTLGNGMPETELLEHDEQAEPPVLPYLLSRMDGNECPLPLGVLRCVERPTYEEQLLGQEQQSIQELGAGELEAALRAGDTWEVEA